MGAICNILFEKSSLFILDYYYCYFYYYYNLYTVLSTSGLKLGDNIHNIKIKFKLVTI